MFLLLNIAAYFLSYLVARLGFRFSRNSPVIKLAGLILAWIAGFNLQQWAGMREGGRLMAAASEPEKMTEDFLMTIPDGPNITAGWILTGWIPLLIAWLVSKRRQKRASSAQL